MSLHQQVCRKLLVLVCTCFLIVSCGQQNDQLDHYYQNKKGSYPLNTHHLDEKQNPIFINKLIKQDSLYLLQHAHNPVNWWAWGEDAFAEARKLDKPVLLSIGYSTCHWCHVMERESFEDIEIATFINENFIPIKVDREEHPDIDEVYLTAVQMLSGKAGWPLTAILTADAQPFFGGTYFAPEQFLSVLEKVNNTWVEKREAIIEQAERIETALNKINNATIAAKNINQTAIADAQQHIQQNLLKPEKRNQSTFPREPEMLFLLRQAFNTLDPEPLSIVQQRLNKLAAGGIHDQLGGGFHRYSVDSEWQIPHFEKMLYNQAQMGQLYSLTYQLSRDPKQRRLAESTLNFILTDMQSPTGGFYSAIDAESEGREGTYYIWHFDELKSLLNGTELALISEVYDISPIGNFEGHNVLVRRNEQTQNATENADKLLASINKKLLDARNLRPRPLTDTKIITSWNSLAISALLTGYQATNNEDYRTAALLSAELIWNKAYSAKKGLSRTLPSGKTIIAGTLEDYAYYSNALLDIFDLTNENRWLQRAEEISTQMVERFYNQTRGGFSISSYKGEKGLVVDLISARDDALVSGNSMAAQTLARLYKRTGNADYRQIARSVIASFSKQLLNRPESLSGMLNAAALLNNQEISQRQYAGKGTVVIKNSIDDDKLTLTLDIAKDWHINAANVLENNLIPTSLVGIEEHCSNLKNIQYPKGKRVSLGFQDSELLVYENQITITADINKTGIETCPLVAGELSIQACSNEVCHSPEKIQIRAIPDN